MRRSTFMGTTMLTFAGSMCPVDERRISDALLVTLILLLLILLIVGIVSGLIR